MSETEGNGPVGKRPPQRRGDTDRHSDLQAECERLREQVQNLTKERDGLKRLVKVLQSKDEADFYSIVRMVRDEIAKGKAWDPGDEKGWTDFGKVVEELGHEFGK